ncbi:hypothetical protein MKW98_019495 [Papaver atlanticum]|uniref:AB hydrolase-1 domain-containing protein n=1 Tax=Papaver atlanticum TaxID=357466 RepID=A0AAD4S9G7_9MAGN|nr:hypothetical protein MKW98_019495 [Papaver atlanticum]
MEKIGQLTFTAPIPLSSSSESRTQFVSPLLLIHSSNKHSLKLQQEQPQCFKGNGMRRRRIDCSHQIITNASSSPSLTTNSSNSNILEISEIKENSKKWKWRGKYSINYFVVQSSSSANGSVNPPLLLIHGFGASIPHWRRNMKVLAENNTVYAIDLLGFGDSDKPSDFAYTMESWAQLILDFLDEVVQKPTVLVGNSIGSLACVIATSESGSSRVQGLVLLNCSGGMNNKAIVDDWRIKLLLPLFWFIDFLLNQPFIASAIFERVKQRETLKNVLLSVYGNKDSVDDDLVEIIKGPADAAGALDAFVSIITGPPGPNPIKLMRRISQPVLVLWGNEDPFTPLDGPVGRFFSSLPSTSPNITLSVLDGVGHCPHDDRPELVHENLLPWLASLPSS